MRKDGQMEGRMEGGRKSRPFLGQPPGPTLSPSYLELGGEGLVVGAIVYESWAGGTANVPQSHTCYQVFVPASYPPPSTPTCSSSSRVITQKLLSAKRWLLRHVIEIYLSRQQL